MAAGMGRVRAAALSLTLATALLAGLSGRGVGASVTPARALTIPSPVCRPRTAPIPSGPATLVSRTTVPGTGGRVLNLVLDSPAMADQQHVYVLLPKDYDPSGATRYPVLYLFHGAGGSYKDWVDKGVQDDIDYSSVADHLGPFITVMPDDGAWGYYTDWYGTDLDSSSTGPAPAWGTYDIDELIPWVDTHLPVRTDRDGRAIAGLSMGGFGAMHDAAQHPDLFGAAGSFSGAVDTDLDFPVGGEGLNLLSSFFTQGLPEQCIWGDTLTQGVRWHADDPTYLAQNLQGLSLFVASGNGQAGPYDTPGASSTTEDGLIESLIFAMNQQFVAGLTAAGLPYTQYFYGPGTHSWGYWLRDLAHFLPQMSAVFARPVTAAAPAAGTPFNFRTVQTAFSIHGYSFTIGHPAEAFTYLRDVRTGGLSVVGTGTLDVVTPPLYAPGSSHVVAVDGGAHTVRADSTGRLSFTVGLGTAPSVQQFDFTGNDPQSYPHAVVTISPS